MDNKLFVPLLLGTNRQNAESNKVAALIRQHILEKEKIEVKYFQAKDFNFPAEGYGRNINQQFPDWQQAMLQADGLIIVFPEYNHGYPGILKSILDLLLPEYKNKPVGLAAVSDGQFGGARAVENLLPVLRELGLIVLNRSLHFPTVLKLFDENNNLLDPKINERIDRFVEEFIWLANTLKDGRKNS